MKNNNDISIKILKKRNMVRAITNSISAAFNVYVEYQPGTYIIRDKCYKRVFNIHHYSCKNAISHQTEETKVIRQRFLELKDAWKLYQRINYTAKNYQAVYKARIIKQYKLLD